MSLTSFVFIIFCFITLAIYFIVPKKFQWIVLLVSSVIFLFWDNLHISTIIQALVVLVPTYLLGRKIEEHSNTKKGKILLVFGIFIIIGQLFYLKYTNLFIEPINSILKRYK